MVTLLIGPYPIHPGRRLPTEFLLLLRHYGQEAKPLVPVGNKEAVEEIRTLPSCD